LQLVVEQGDSRLTLRWDELNQQGHSLPWISTVVVDGKEISEGRGRGRTKAVARNQAAGVLLETLKERSANRNPSRPQLAEELRKMLN
jgi:dsRNA-specific ribonuclease